ncbi:NAD(P)/FAD-dependent oxidoreductase [Amycolatopsis sp.]|uniref:NAD(P)/FAD-dependent oxidoreductase n=1 Tax=Amycolatopsis sp. TaxID=37632 RepID=UPI002B7CEAD5|nr:FAD-dependent oxidoreductase [Amycolatopsis sp.]HVV11250.1 FAD-dependent oxidoreductase [Amycolatopsis sp.]
MSAPPENVLVIGAGLGGLRTAEQLRARGYPGDITLVGAESHLPYDRPPLSKQVLTGAWPPERVVLRDADGLAALKIGTVLGTPVVRLGTREAELADGRRLRGEAIVLATGATPRRLPGQPAGVHTLRTLEDSLALRAALTGARSLLVVGGGFIGAEVAWAAREQGLRVTVVESLTVPCERALGTTVGAVCARLIREHGVELRTAGTLSGFVDDHTVALSDGERLTADVVLAGVGAVPVTDLLRDHDSHTPDGLSCDSTGRVAGLPGVWAVGDVAAWADPVRGTPFRQEHWTGAAEQAAVVAAGILGAGPAEPVLPYFWSDQFGLKIQGIGRPALADTVVPLQGEGLRGGPVKGTVAGYFARDKLTGVVGFGAARWIARYRPLVTNGADRHEAFALT